MIDTEARSRRNNLIIWGVTEKLKINCPETVNNFLQDELDLATDTLVIDRAHRLGSLTNPSYRGKSDP